jgi:ribosomal protein S18 acetylase RimI-like enzyme
VLRLPLALDLTAEEVAQETDQLHFVAFEGGEVVGCALLKPSHGEAKMRQVAVRPELQGQGIGRILVQAFEAEAQARGYPSIVLNARETAVPFYERLGYEVFGEAFEEVTIPHRSLRKHL